MIMKTLVVGLLLAATLVSATGCHWRHRNWRNYRDYGYNSYQSGDHFARDRRMINAERDS
jgi:hypothetical protein